MSRARKQDKGKKPRGSLSQFGLFDMPDIDGMGLKDGDNMDMDDDDDLEDELNMILGTTAEPPPPSRRAPAKAPGAVVANLDTLIATTLKDETSDGEDEDVDEDDPSLLAELSQLTGVEVPPPAQIASPTRTAPPPPITPSLVLSQPQDDTMSVLKERLSLYTEAEQAARHNNDTSKARRYKRGVDQCRELMKRLEVGGAVSQEEIPVPVAVPKPNPPTPAVVPTTPSPNQERSVGAVEQTEESRQEMISVLTARRDQYKAAAVAAKRRNDIESALTHIRIIKQFDVILEAVERGQTIDMSTMPPPPPAVDDPPPSAALPAVDKPADKSSADTSVEQPAQGEEVPLTVLGALEARLAKYQEQEESAKQEGNQSKARRMGRIVKQYKEAVALHNRGRPIPIDELPTPPGFPPIPVEGGGGAPASDATTPGPSANASADPAAAQRSSSGVSPAPSPDPTAEQKSPVAPSSPAQQPVSPPSRPAVSPTPSQTSSAPGRGGAQTRSERQLAVLLQRQKEYKEAALKAKMANNIPKAKEYLTLAKGFDAVIEASRSGLPVDMDTLPRPLSKKSPELESFELVRIDDCIEGSDMEIFDRLLTDLNNQLKMCVETLNHFKAIGDIGNANRFENLALNTKRDINTVRGAHITCSSVPKFHYEQRSFSIVRCNVDLNDNELELNIIKGINYNVPNPKEIDTYIRYEFPFPNDEVKSEKTSTVYNTNNPEYKTVFMIPIQRTSRSFQRLFKRHSVKLHVWSKGGFLRSDQLVATVQVKLQALETKCTIHDAFDLMDGRRALGGKLEVKLRLRNPIATKQIDQVNEKWLVID